VLLCASEANCQILGQLLSPVDDQKFAARIAGRRNIKRFAIVDRTGKVLYVGRTSDPVVGFAVGAPAVQRLMIMGGQTRLNHGRALSRLAFDVLDLHTMEFVLKTTLQSSGIKHGGWTIMRRPDAAISPDGCKIAILVGSELRLYRLPAEQVDDVSGSKTRN
jgi:hypothetical protein